MPREDFRLSHRLRVRWAEVDKQGIVFNGHYLSYFDVAVTEYWRAAGRVYPDEFRVHGIDTFAVKATLEYHAAAEFDEEIDVMARVARMGRSSLRFVFEIHRADVHLVSGEIIYVFATVSPRKSSPVPQPLRAAIVAYEKTPPEQP